MTEKLSYEEWRLKYKGIVVIPDEVRKDLKEFHNIDADEEIEWAIRKEYEFYLSWKPTTYTKEQLIDLLKDNICQVTFTKVNGEQRVMPCTLRAESLPAVVKESTTKKEPNPNTLAVYVTDINQWRSFRVDSVTDVTVI